METGIVVCRQPGQGRGRPAQGSVRWPKGKRQDMWRGGYGSSPLWTAKRISLAFGSKCQFQGPSPEFQAGSSVNVAVLGEGQCKGNERGTDRLADRSSTTPMMLHASWHIAAGSR